MEGVLLNTAGTSAAANSTSLKLEGQANWSTWKFQVRIILKALEIYEVVDGSTVQPKEETQKIKWQKKDAKAQSVLVTRLSNQVMLQVMTCETAKSIWDKLHIIYEQSSETSLHLLQQKFFTLQFSEGEDMATFLARVEEIVSQIKQAKGEVPENMVLTKVLTSLPDTYKHFVSAWDSVPVENQTLSVLTGRLLIEEQRTNNRQEVKEVTALVMKQKSENRKCFRCGKIGHYKKDCRVNNKKYCEHCKKKGHNKKDCWFLKKKENDNRAERSNAFSVTSLASYRQPVIHEWIVVHQITCVIVKIISMNMKSFLKA